MIIAIDGPAASGKGTLARRLAAHYGLRHLDTGLLYRAVGHQMLVRGLDPNDAEAAERVAADLDLEAMDEAPLRTAGVGEAASIVAAHQGVRSVLLDLQRQFAGTPPGAVLDGRDIGTVVCPDAPFKLYVTATAEVRAGRRHVELVKGGDTISQSQVLDDIHRRDKRDGERATAPMRAAADAYLLDTSNLDIEAAFRVAVDYVDRTRGG